MDEQLLYIPEMMISDAQTIQIQRRQEMQVVGLAVESLGLCK